MEGQVARYKTAAENAERVEDELKAEKRKLQREVTPDANCHRPAGRLHHGERGRAGTVWCILEEELPFLAEQRISACMFYYFSQVCLLLCSHECFRGSTFISQRTPISTFLSLSFVVPEGSLFWVLQIPSL